MRAPLEALIAGLVEAEKLVGEAIVVLVGESALKDLQLRPDYAVSVGGALIGFIEVKAPGNTRTP